MDEQQQKEALDLLVEAEDRINLDDSEWGEPSALAAGITALLDKHRPKCRGCGLREGQGHRFKCPTLGAGQVVLSFNLPEKP